MFIFLCVMRPPDDHSDPIGLDQPALEVLKKAPIPLLWLFGKTGSGKSSIIKMLTGASAAEIGNGFRPQTLTSMQFDFPDDQTPIARFLDTRGIGEAGYEAQVDLRAFDQLAHLMIVPVRLTDQATDCIVQPLRQFRKANPHRKVILAISCLHDAYPGDQHPDPNPLVKLDRNVFSHTALTERSRAVLRVGFSERVLSLVQQKLEVFSDCIDAWVMIDLTGEKSGFEEVNFGAQELKEQILEHLPSAYRQSMRQIEHLNQSFLDAHQLQCAPVIMGHSLLAASAAAIPLPWVDIPVVLAIQSRLAFKLAELNRQPLDKATLSRVTAAIGGRVAVQLGIREGLKLIPWVGMAVNSAATFAYTYATGWAWNWYFTKISAGHLPSDAELRKVYADQLKAGESFWKRSNENESI